MSLIKKLIIFFAVVTVTTIFLTTCSLNPSGSNTEKLVKILGKLNNDIISVKPLARAIDNDADKLWIMPLGDGNPYGVSDRLTDSKFIKINADGTFEVLINTTTADNWILLLIDSTQQDKKDRVVGYVTMGQGMIVC